MASSNFIGGPNKYSGKVEYVGKTFGFIRLIDDQPVSRAYFDQSSANMHGCDLTDTFSRDSRVYVNIIPTDGEHKVKYKAINVSLHEPKIQKDDPSIRGGDHYLRKYLKDNGPFNLEELAERLRSATDNCPRFLKNGGVEDIRKVSNCNPEIFEIKNDVLCLSEIEKEIADEFLENMDAHENKISMDMVNSIIRPDHEHRRYLHTVEQWNIGVKNFVARNANEFVFWKNAIWKKKYIRENEELNETFKKEMAAVKYYSVFVIKKSPISVKSLLGHRGQADDEVKQVSPSKEQDFTEFLENNSFFFILRGNNVKECVEHRLPVIDMYWLGSKRTRPRRTRGKGGKDIKKTNQAESAAASQSSATMQNTDERSRRTAEQAPPKAFADFDFMTLMKNPVPCSSEVQFPSTSYAAQYGFQTAVPTQPSLLQNKTSSGYKKGKTFASKDEQIFKQLVGETISDDLEKEICKHGQGFAFNYLLLLRMNIGKPPMAKFRVPGKDGSLNCSLKIDPVKSEDLQKLLRQKEVMKSCTSGHYGVKETLHSIRTLEQGGKVTGLTLFCQLHEDNDGLALNILERKNFTAVFTGNYPVKYIYDYLRCKCNELSKSEDVLVIDFDGQLSGHDDQTHPSLGNVSRIICSSSPELTEKITEAVQHMHEYVIITGIDSVDQLRALQRMRSKDTRVLAELPSDLKSEVNSMFS
uniref:uncharacterized protein LOC120339255 isoform X1 n=1 Tax=Styela clava TaxID=7725 RepID=UPI00193A8E14|nr:uncharacterized protein LOC120339255 isoform X1 [Styela clava]